MTNHIDKGNVEAEYFPTTEMIYGFTRKPPQGFF